MAFDLKIIGGHCDLYFKCSVGLHIDQGWGASCPGHDKTKFALYLEDYFIYEHNTLGL